MIDFNPEKFLPIVGYEEKYLISNHGNVFSVISDRLIVPYRNSREYLQIALCGRKFYVHRLVAITFIENPDELPEVNHINGRQKDNRLLNLEWISGPDNLKHRDRLQKYYARAEGVEPYDPDSDEPF